MGEGDVKFLCDTPIIDGKKVMVFECGRPPVDDYGDADVVAFAADSSSNRDVYYEAHDMTVNWFKSPFYVGRTCPSQEELTFQLRKWHSERQIKFTIGAAVGVLVLFLLFK